MLSLVHFTSTVNNFQHNKMVIGIWSPSDKENMVFSMSEIGGKVFYYNDRCKCLIRWIWKGVCNNNYYKML